MRMRSLVAGVVGVALAAATVVAAPAWADDYTVDNDGAFHTVTGGYRQGAAFSAGVESPEKLLASPDGSTLYVLGGTTTATSVAVIDAATGVARARVDVGASETGDMVLSPDGSRLYVALPDLNEISVLNSSGTPISTIAMVDSPGLLAISPDGAQLYVDAESAAGATVLDDVAVASASVVSSAYLGRALITAMSVVTAAGVSTLQLADAHYGELRSYSLAASPTPDGSRSVGSLPCSIASSPDGTTSYVGNDDKQGTLDVIKAGGRPSAYVVGNEPCALSVTPDGSTLIIGEYGSSSLDAYDVGGNAVIDTELLGGAPESIATTEGGASFYVLEAASSSAPNGLIAPFATSPVWVHTGKVALSGKAVAEGTLGITLTGWTPAASSYTVAWNINDKVVAHGLKWKIPLKYAGKSVSATVSITAPWQLGPLVYNTNRATVAETQVKGPAPKITGKAVVGSTLRINLSRKRWPKGTRFDAVWYIGTTHTEKVFSTALSVTKSMVGKRIRVVVTARLKYHTARSVPSTWSKPVPKPHAKSAK